jgi:hypothetical protein
MFCCVSDPALARVMAGDPEDRTEAPVTAGLVVLLLAGYAAVIASFFAPLILR